MTTRLRELIRGVRACKTAAEERALIAKESAALRAAFKDLNDPNRYRNVVKLMFMHMLGYPTHFGQMECIKLVSAAGFPEKRIGYLGLMVLLDERQEVLMLVTNSLKNDLSNKNQYIVGLALCSLGDICSTEMGRDLAPEVERLMGSSNPYIRKKAALCAVRIVKKVPELADSFIEAAPDLLRATGHGVVLAGISLALTLCQTSESALARFRREVHTLVRVLKSLVHGGNTLEHGVGGITDPFLQVKVLRLLRLLGAGDAEASDTMSDILAQVATNTDGSKNAGNAVLYECVQTIMGVESIGGLRVLAINILARFLRNRDNNIRYVALNTLASVVAIDTQAVQRHRTTIVECVKDNDVSIRRRALELVYSLVNENNITTLTKELIEYLMVSDLEFKYDLTQRICALVAKFAPDKRWHVDTLIRVLVQAGVYVKDEVCHGMVTLVSNAPELHGYASRALYRALSDERTNPALLMVGSWCIGEYGDMVVSGEDRLEDEPPLAASPSDVVNRLSALLADPSGSLQVRQYVLMALIKLTTRLGSEAPRITALVGKYKSSMALELQQRTCEFDRLQVQHAPLQAPVLERMPPLDVEAFRARAEGREAPDAAGGATLDTPAGAPAAGADSTAAAAGQLADLLNMDMLGDDAPAAGAPPAAAADSLMDLLGGGGEAAPAPSAAAPVDPLMDLMGGGAPAPAAPVDPLMDLMGGGAPVPTPAPAVAPAADPMADLFGGPAFAAAAAVPPPPDSFVGYSNNGLTITLACAKPPGEPANVTVVTATYTNDGPSPLTNFLVQAAVPKFAQLQMQPASSAVVPAAGGGSVTQSMKVVNSMVGQKALAMRVKIAYSVGGKTAVNEEATITGFPAGC